VPAFNPAISSVVSKLLQAKPYGVAPPVIVRSINPFGEAHEASPITAFEIANPPVLFATVADKTIAHPLSSVTVTS